MISCSKYATISYDIQDYCAVPGVQPFSSVFVVFGLGRRMH